MKKNDAQDFRYCTTAIKCLWQNKNSRIQISVSQLNFQFFDQYPVPNSREIFTNLQDKAISSCIIDLTDTQ